MLHHALWFNVIHQGEEAIDRMQTPKLKMKLGLQLDAQATSTLTPVHRLRNTCSTLLPFTAEGTRMEIRNHGFIDF